MSANIQPLMTPADIPIIYYAGPRPTPGVWFLSWKFYVFNKSSTTAPIVIRGEIRQSGHCFGKGT